MNDKDLRTIRRRLDGLLCDCPENPLYGDVTEHKDECPKMVILEILDRQEGPVAIKKDLRDIAEGLKRPNYGPAENALGRIRYFFMCGLNEHRFADCYERIMETNNWCDQ